MTRISRTSLLISRRLIRQLQPKQYRATIERILVGIAFPNAQHRCAKFQMKFTKGLPFLWFEICPPEKYRQMDLADRISVVLPHSLRVYSLPTASVFTVTAEATRSDSPVTTNMTYERGVPLVSAEAI